MEEKITPPRMVSALPAADAASSPTDTKSLAQRALQTVVSAPAEMDKMLSSWKSKTCAAPSNTPSLAAREPVRAQTTTTFATLPMYDPVSCVYSIATFLLKLYAMGSTN